MGVFPLMLVFTVIGLIEYEKGIRVFLLPRPFFHIAVLFLNPSDNNHGT